MQRVDLQPAYILHQRPYRDTSAIVDVLTPEFGRMSVLAKGIKRPKSRWQGQLRAFQPMLVSWSGRSELMTLTHVEISGQHLRMPGNRLSSGLYLNELIIRLVQKFEPQIELFSDYDNAVREISSFSDTEEQHSWLLQTILRRFEIRLLRSLGYEVIFGTEAGTGKPVQPVLNYSYHHDHGPVRVDSRIDNCELNQDSCVMVSGRTLLMMSQPENLLSSQDPQVFAEAKKLMRAILGYHLGSKPIVSREMFLAKV